MDAYSYIYHGFLSIVIHNYARVYASGTKLFASSCLIFVQFSLILVPTNEGPQHLASLNGHTHVMCMLYRVSRVLFHAPLTPSLLELMRSWFLTSPMKLTLSQYMLYPYAHEASIMSAHITLLSCMFILMGRSSSRFVIYI